MDTVFVLVGDRSSTSHMIFSQQETEATTDVSGSEAAWHLGWELLTGCRPAEISTSALEPDSSTTRPGLTIHRSDRDAELARHDARERIPGHGRCVVVGPTRLRRNNMARQVPRRYPETGLEEQSAEHKHRRSDTLFRRVLHRARRAERISGQGN